MADFSVAVIIPTFNRAAFLPKALDSVLAQTYPPAEIIVVDDGSLDETIEVLDRYQGNIRILHLDENRGVSFARNRGIEAARSRWIALLDSDDYWQPEKLKRQVEYHRVHPGLRISQTDEIWIRGGRRVNPRRKHTKPAGHIFKVSLPLCLISPSAVMFEKTLWTEVGGFDENLPVCEDYDLWLRITRAYPVGLVNEALVTKTGGHSDQLSTAEWGLDRYRILAMEKHLDSELPSDLQRAVLEELITKGTIVATGAGRHNNHALFTYYTNKVKSYRKMLLRLP